MGTTAGILLSDASKQTFAIDFSSPQRADHHRLGVGQNDTAPTPVYHMQTIGAFSAVTLAYDPPPQGNDSLYFRIFLVESPASSRITKSHIYEL